MEDHRTNCCLSIRHQKYYFWGKCRSGCNLGTEIGQNGSTHLLPTPYFRNIINMFPRETYAILNHEMLSILNCHRFCGAVVQTIFSHLNHRSIQNLMICFMHGMISIRSRKIQEKPPVTELLKDSLMSSLLGLFQSSDLNCYEQIIRKQWNQH